MSDTLGIVIVNYNSDELLRKCVDSIFESDLDDISLRVVVVDNNSSDNSLELSREENDKFIIIRNTKNIGFGAACNQGQLKVTDKEYLLFLNPDTEVAKNTFKDSLVFLKSNKEVSILGVSHKGNNGGINASCSRTPILKRIIWDILGFSKLLPRIFKPATVMLDYDHKSSKFVDQVMGAYMLMKTDVFKSLNGFDERFFVYFEDADFALRAKQKGCKSFYNSEIEIVHHGRGTTAKISDISLFYNLRSRMQFVKKHYGKFNGVIIQILTLIIEPLTRIGYNCIKNPKENKNTIKAFVKLYKDLF